MKNFLILLCIISCLIKVNAQEDIRNFIFGHSLLDHRPPAIPTPSNETTVPHWLFLLSQEADINYSATGQYGFLQQHDNLPPFAQWGYDIVPAVWESDTESFSDADFTNVIITAGNFMQWQPPTEPYYNDPDDTSPISATITISDWLVQQEDSIHILIYENWPDMAPYMQSFPPNADEFQSYNDYTLGDFHDWWIEYHDALRAHNPMIKMVPVGPALASLFQQEPYSSIELTELYEDDAPHGRASLYFLASMTTYMAMTQEKCPENFQVPSIIDPIIQENYLEINDFLWNYLVQFNDNQGVSRVFCNEVINAIDNSSQQEFKIFPNPSKGIIQVESICSNCDVEIFNSTGMTIYKNTFSNSKQINITPHPSGLYFVKIQEKSGKNFVQKFIKE